MNIQTIANPEAPRFSVSVYAFPGMVDYRKLSFNIESIIEIIENSLNVSFGELKKKNRKRNGFVLPRFVIMYFAQKYTKMSLKDIGRHFISEEKPRGYSHCNVLHARKTIQNTIDTDKNFKKEMAKIEAKILNRMMIYEIHKDNG